MQIARLASEPRCAHWEGGGVVCRGRLRRAVENAPMNGQNPHPTEQLASHAEFDIEAIHDPSFAP